MFRTVTTPRFPTAAQVLLRNITTKRKLTSGKALREGTENAFIKERQAVKQHAASTAGLWRKLSIYVAIPFLIVSGINAKLLWDEHWEHWKHMPPIEERVQYPYQNWRAKNYPWGDGDKTLFWNDKVNYNKKDD